MKLLLSLLLLFTLFFTLPLSAQRVTIDFEEYASGVTLSSQSSLTELGISFSNGLSVIDCRYASGVCDAGFDGAKSGNKVGMATYITEFRRDEIIIRFEERQDSVIFYLKPANDYLNMQVSIEGWADGLDVPISGGTATFFNNSFIRYKLTTCDEIRLSARTNGASINDNWLIIDDINFKIAEEVTEDNTNPYVNLSLPYSGYESTSGIIPIEGYAYDNVQLDTVELYIYDETGIIKQTNYCGRAGVACPLGTDTYYFNSTTDITNLENGTYTIKMRAVDASGNQYYSNRTISLNMPADPPDVSVHKIELNQAVQNALFEVDGPGNVSTANSSTPLLPERNTLVRYYLTTDSGERYNYTAKLKLTIFYEDGSNSSTFIQPNVTNFTAVDTVWPKPGTISLQTEQLTKQRASLNKTLNFVIEKDLLINADIIGLTLFEGIQTITGQLQISLWTPTEFGISYYRIKDDAPRPSVFVNNIGDYIEATYPISKLHQRYEGEIIIELGFNLIAELAGWSDASRYRRVLKSSLFGRWPEVFYTPEHAHWRVILGVMDPWAGGNATRGDADKNRDRYYGIASTSSRGNVGAHETGHLIGLKHAGKAHGECGGGGCEEFVNINGTLNGENTYLSDFGIVLKENTSGSTFDAFLIDPCPVSSVMDRISGCEANVIDTDPEPVRPFDMMSYGEPTTWSSFPLDSRSKQWISIHNYKRIYFAIRDRNDIKSAMTSHQDPIIQPYLQIDGIIVNDSAYLYHILEKPMDKNLVDELSPSEGNYQVLLLDNLDNVLSEKFFHPDSVLDNQTCCALNFNVAVPKPNNFYKIIIKDELGNTVYEKEASVHKPEIKLITDLSGQNITDSTLTLTWKANDADDEPLTVSFEYSPDKGKTWVPLAYLEETQDTSITIKTDHLQKSDSAIIKAMVSDGIYTEIDANPETFCLQANGSCNGKPVTEYDLGLVTKISNNKIDRNDLSLDVYPNPTKSNVVASINVHKPLSMQLQIYNAMGQLVKTEASQQLTPGKNIVPIVTSPLPPGVYHIMLNAEGNIKVKTLIIKR